MKITINNQDIELKYSFRSLIIYENIMDKTFQPESVTEIIVYFYSVILASKKDIELSYESFLDWLDENETSLNDFSVWLMDREKQQSHIKKK